MNTDEKLTITMSGRRPLSIIKADWPILAPAYRSDGGIHVREHADGRRIVYGYWRHGGTPEAGFLVAAGDEEATVRAILCVGKTFGLEHLANECIASLPPEELVT